MYDTRNNTRTISKSFELDVNLDWRSAEKRHKFKSACGKYIYHLAVIDYLTEFDYSKKLEMYWKQFICFIKRRDSRQVSAVPPPEYFKRFNKLMQKEYITNEKEDKKNQREKLMVDDFQKVYD